MNPLVQLALADLLAAVTLMFTSAMNETHTFTPSVLICEKLLPLSLVSQSSVAIILYVGIMHYNDPNLRMNIL